MIVRIDLTERGAASEDEMVSAFLKAGVDSTRFGPSYRAWLSQFHLDRSSLIDQADLANSKDNKARIELLKAVRGYKANQYLFAGFPDDVEWRRVAMEPIELGKLKYAKYGAWIALSEGSRRVSDGAKNNDKIDVGEDINSTIRSMAKRVRQGDNFPELIVVHAEGSDLVLVEGSKRATAYVLGNRSSSVQLLVGRSSKMQNWAFY